ncbi:YdcF family protein [Aestuariirhabdus sp. Z084]|uniref:YdcF family protein n=1 Tax=Aestuariirhabdus haliotis TaxID=2918751 RepID=UPI00201B35AC|nr:YdcF family protein [Aestuariirhabdus haliotis]MCL6416718.1 YdcF family protein [Aestuariirhabdus haliotis]MCL6420693.1 YdcF family protein [Aestuariirhabdus haliotis]
MLSWMLLKSLILPPGIQLVTALVGGLSLRRWPWFGYSLLLISLLSLYLLSTPFIATGLARTLESQATVVSTEALQQAQLIVVPGAGRRPPAAEYDGQERPSGLASERLFYAAYLANQTSLDLMVTGGRVISGERESEAALMARQLRQELGVPVSWQEGNSRTTRENAIHSRHLLPRSINRIVLVTHALHMPRAQYVFEKAGFEVVAAPLGYHPLNTELPVAALWLPSVRSLLLSRDALHEWLGMLWYRLQDRLTSDV